MLTLEWMKQVRFPDPAPNWLHMMRVEIERTEFVMDMPSWLEAEPVDVPRDVARRLKKACKSAQDAKRRRDQSETIDCKGAEDVRRAYRYVRHHADMFGYWKAEIVVPADRPDLLELRDELFEQREAVR